MWRVILILCSLLPAVPLQAETEDAALQRLLTLEEARPWASVGRVNVSGSAYCTGSLIAPDLVLTAAHCLFFSRTGRPVPPEEVQFLAGYRKGSFLAQRKARRYAVHPDYDPKAEKDQARLLSDIAVLELEKPVPASVTAPFERARHPRTGDPVALVSYARERSEVPSIQEPCHVLARQGRVMFLSCSVNHGSSGAPVFVRTDGSPRVAALISAMTEWEGRRVAVAVELDEVLDEVLAKLAVPEPERKTVTPEAASLARQLGRDTVPEGGRKIALPPPSP